jgi:hypothetical protein
MLNIRTIAVSAALSILLAASASAQTTPPTTQQTPGATTAAPKAGAPATTAPAAAPKATAPAAAAPAPSAPAPGGTVAPTAKTKKAAVPTGPRTPESLACSKEADDKNIHGKKKAGDPTSVSRASFMKKCVADAMKKAGKPPVKKG